MKRTLSETFDSSDKTKEQEKNRVIVENIREMTRTSVKKGAGRYEEPVREVVQPLQNSIFKRYAKSIKKSIVPSLKRDCEICEISYSPLQLAPMAECNHLFCEPCAASYLTYKVNAFEEVLCPRENCGSPINKNSRIYTGLAIELKKKFDKREKFALTQKDPSLKLCQKPDCEGLVKISETPAMCSECRTIYCPLCMYEKHDGECSNFQVEFLQNNYKFRQCNACKNVVEKNQGCNHITCRCGHQFCYICGADWDKDPCRGLGPVPPPPPPEPRGCCGCLCIWTLKILLIPLWAIFGVLIVFVPFLLFVLMILLISFFGGPCEFMMSKMQSDNCCCMILLILCMPFLYLIGIPVFFVSQCGEMCDSLRDCFGFYCEVLRSLSNWE